MIEIISQYREIILDLYPKSFILACISVIITSWLAIKIFPVIIHLCQHKNLMDEPGNRKVHLQNIPNLGGVGLFVSFTVAVTALGSIVGLPEQALNKLLALVTGVTILFFLGVKDDMIGLSPAKKFAGQTVAALLVIVATDVRIHSLEGILGVGVLPYYVSVLFSLFVFILVINAYNLIDGIDGLAGAIAVIVSSVFGLLFLFNEQYLWLLVSFALIGSVRGFLKFNLSEKNKVFMGDSGSMFLGFVLAYEAIGFLGLNSTNIGPTVMPNGPILVMAILSFPLLDTLRVFIVRIYKRKSPFTADKNHIHHRLLKLGLTHKQASLLIAGLNLIIILLALLIRDFNINLQLLIIGSVGPLICLLPCAIKKSKRGKIMLAIRGFENA
jgi:UDP-N-acetylmuramyl pentapeptide phosphotransferase/UDP-N-acetylglucosamine-1-phosphate transferase